MRFVSDLRHRRSEENPGFKALFCFQLPVLADEFFLDHMEFVPRCVLPIESDQRYHTDSAVDPDCNEFIDRQKGNRNVDEDLSFGGFHDDSRHRRADAVKRLPEWRQNRNRHRAVGNAIGKILCLCTDFSSLLCKGVQKKEKSDSLHSFHDSRRGLPSFDSGERRGHQHFALPGDIRDPSGKRQKKGSEKSRYVSRALHRRLPDSAQQFILYE